MSLKPLYPTPVKTCSFFYPRNTHQLFSSTRTNPAHRHLKQVILANAPVSDDVMEAVGNSNVPNGVMNQINRAQVGKSERDHNLINSPCTPDFSGSARALLQ